MDTPIDLEAYLRRIAWRGPAPRADLASLQQLVVLHAAAIPFENLNPWLGLPVPLALAALQEKLVFGRRGGYCFEQNGLFRAMLSSLGFEVQGLSARVMSGLQPTALTQRSHRLLLVSLREGPYIVDVGFGGMTLTGALQLVDALEQSTAHETFKLSHRPQDTAGDWHLQACVAGDWRTLYRFDLQLQAPIDDEMPNLYQATHPSSRFVRELVAARALPGRRLALLNRDLRIHHTHGNSEHRQLQNPEQLLAVLTQEFGLDVPEHPRLAQRLTALFSPTPATESMPPAPSTGP